MSRKLKILLAFLLALSLFFLWGVTFYPCSATIPSGDSLEPPSPTHYFGTDNLGIDIFAQLSRGFYVSMLIGILAALVSFVLGGVLGVLAGYYQGKVDLAISFVIHVFLSVPQLPIMIVMGVFLGQSIFNVILIVAFFSWAPIAKMVRAKTMDIRNKDYIRVAKSYGGGTWYIIRTHMLREILPLVMVNSLGVINKAIIQEASLAFLGLSDPISKSWGLMINKAINFSGIYFTDYWKWWLIPPVLCLMLTIFLLRLSVRELDSKLVK